MALDIIDWLKSNWITALAVILIGYFLYTMFFNKKSQLKPLNRAEKEYKLYDERMSLNYSFYKWLYYGNILLGRIEKFRITNLNLNKESPVPIMETKIKPCIFNWVVPIIHYEIRLTFPFFTKSYFLIIARDNIRRDNITKELIFKRDIEVSGGFDKFEHIYFDRTLEDDIHQYVNTTMLYKTDLENSLSLWYAKAQEQATMNPQYAFEIMKKTLDLEQAKEKRAMATTPSS